VERDYNDDVVIHAMKMSRRHEELAPKRGQQP
jgi:hypothetical protein